MRRGIAISLAVLLVAFFTIGCTDTGTDDAEDTEVVPPTEDGEVTGGEEATGGEELVGGEEAVGEQ